jgi:hypothetical protein
MIAATIFAMTALGVMQMLQRSYELTALARYHDNGRAVLRTFADQFQRLATTEKVGGTTYTRWLFNVTPGPTGKGLVWGSLSDAPTSDGSLPDTCTVTLGDGAQAITANVTRDVRYINTSNGAVMIGRNIEAAGYVLQATFSVTYTVSGRAHTQSLVMSRAVP